MHGMLLSVTASMLASSLVSEDSGGAPAVVGSRHTELLDHDEEGDELDIGGPLGAPGAIIRIKGANSQADGVAGDAGGCESGGGESAQSPAARRRLPLRSDLVVLGLNLGSWS